MGRAEQEKYLPRHLTCTIAEKHRPMDAYRKEGNRILQGKRQIRNSSAFCHLSVQGQGDTTMTVRFSICCALLIGCFICISWERAGAVSYTIQLKNGNELKSDKYWEEGEVIRFYTTEGIVGIPKKIVAQIVTVTGNIDLQTKKEVSKALDQEDQQLEEIAGTKRQEGQRDEEVINNIKDQIVVIDSNLEALAKNKNLYGTQLEQYRQQKQKSEERIRTLTTDRFVTAEDNKESIKFEQSKIKDFEDKIRELEEKIERTEKMIEAQTRIRERLEGELMRIKRE